MLGIRFHGRGGQGAVTASKILAHAYFQQGLYVQAFPAFGMERRGAPVAAFVRIDASPILERGEIKRPSMVIVLDPTLLQTADITAGMPPGGTILLNHPDEPEDVGIDGDYRLATVDASRIALDHGLGSELAPIVNTVILGALNRLMDDLDLENLLSAIEADVPVKADKNMAAAKAAYDQVRRSREA